MQKRGTAVKKVIVEAAAQSFRNEGYRATSVDSIARKAGVSKATVYSHFTNKDGLFRATVQEIIGPILELLPAARPVADVREELVRFAENFSAALMTPEKAEWDRMIISTAKKFPELAESYFKSGPARGMNHLARFLEAQNQEGKLEIKDPEFSAELLCGMLFGTRILRNLICPDRKPFDRHKIEMIIDAFVKVHTP